MARYSGANYRPLAAKQGQPAMKKHDIVCLHTMVGNLHSTDTMFHSGGWSGTESHFGVGGIWGADAGKNYDGKVFQWQDTAYTADANYQGNPRIISIETADNAPGLVRDIRPWTDKQLDAIVKLVAWACRTHDIPAVLVADSKPSRRGIAYHRLGCEHSLGVGKVPGFLVAGGERWSTSKGKECPGPQRIAQIKTIIVPRVKALLAPTVSIPIAKPVEASSVSILDTWEVTLTTETQVRNMNINNPATPYKIGDTLDLKRFMLWGGPGDERLLHELRAIASIEKANAVQLQRVEDLLETLTATLSTPATTGEARSV